MLYAYGFLTTEFMVYRILLFTRHKKRKQPALSMATGDNHFIQVVGDDCVHYSTAQQMIQLYGLLHNYRPSLRCP